VKRYLDRSLKPGAVLSNEPGCYIPGHFGVRIENIVCIREKKIEPLIQDDKSDGAATTSIMYLENFTMVPFCRKLIEKSLLTAEEITWVNNYHAKIVAIIGPELCKMGLLDTVKWLRRECTPL